MTTDLLAYAKAHAPKPRCWVCRNVPSDALAVIDAAKRDGVVSVPSMLNWLADPDEWGLEGVTLHKLKDHFGGGHHLTEAA